jgi:hypothetical protein
MIDVQATLQHHFFEISIAERIAQIPANTEQDNVSLEVAPFERVLVIVAHEEIFFSLFSSL